MLASAEKINFHIEATLRAAEIGSLLGGAVANGWAGDSSRALDGGTIA